MNNIDRSAKQPRQNNTILTNPRRISDIISEYTTFDMKLQKYGKHVPSDAENDFSKHTNKQNNLLDQQQNLLSEAQSLQIDGIDDITALIKLWYLEEINHIKSSQLSKSQLLILSVYDHLVNSRPSIN